MSILHEHYPAAILEDKSGKAKALEIIKFPDGEPHLQLATNARSEGCFDIICNTKDTIERIIYVWTTINQRKVKGRFEIEDNFMRFTVCITHITFIEDTRQIVPEYINFYGF